VLLQANAYIIKQFWGKNNPSLVIIVFFLLSCKKVRPTAEFAEITEIFEVRFQIVQIAPQNLEFL
jgi:hypothetical protein